MFSACLLRRSHSSHSRGTVNLVLAYHPPRPRNPYTLSPVRSISPAGGWNMIDRPSSYSPLGSGHRSSAGGRRRFFGLSETAEAEAEAAALLAKRSESAGGKGGAAACGEGTPTVAGNSDGGAQKHCIEAHRFLLSLRSDPMRAMLGSGKCD